MLVPPFLNLELYDPCVATSLEILVDDDYQKLSTNLTGQIHPRCL